MLLSEQITTISTSIIRQDKRIKIEFFLLLSLWRSFRILIHRFEIASFFCTMLQTLLFWIWGWICWVQESSRGFWAWRLSDEYNDFSVWGCFLSFSLYTCFFFHVILFSIFVFIFLLSFFLSWFHSSFRSSRSSIFANTGRKIFKIEMVFQIKAFVLSGGRLYK